MAVMNDRELLAALENGTVSITPVIHNNIQLASIDLTLHKVIDIFEPREPLDLCGIDMETLDKFTREVQIDAGYTLQPGDFVTGYSEEMIRLPSFIGGRIFNRNSLARCGLNAAISAFINPGFKGRKVIVIHNFGCQPLTIHPGMRICQLELNELSSATVRSFEDRHNPAKLPGNDRWSSGPGLPSDNSLSEFLAKRIRVAAERLS